MKSRDKNSYLNLIHYILHLINEEDKLNRLITLSEMDVDGLTFRLEATADERKSLHRVQSTLERIRLNHEDLVNLIRERIDLKERKQQFLCRPIPDYKAQQIQDQLVVNKVKISEIINPIRM